MTTETLTLDLETYDDNTAQVLRLLLDYTDGAGIMLYAARHGYDLNEAENWFRTFEEEYNGFWRSPGDFAEDIVLNCYDTGEFLDGPLGLYFDYERFAEDLLDGDFYSIPGEGGDYYFRSI
jgi:antirestriction protein